MATNFFELATTLKNLGAKWLSEKKVNFTPCARKNNVRPAKHTFLMDLVFAREQNEILILLMKTLV